MDTEKLMAVYQAYRIEDIDRRNALDRRYNAPALSRPFIAVPASPIPDASGYDLKQAFERSLEEMAGGQEQFIVSLDGDPSGIRVYFDPSLSQKDGKLEGSIRVWGKGVPHFSGRYHAGHGFDCPRRLDYSDKVVDKGLYAAILHKIKELSALMVKVDARMEEVRKGMPFSRREMRDAYKSVPARRNGAAPVFSAGQVLNPAALESASIRLKDLTGMARKGENTPEVRAEWTAVRKAAEDYIMRDGPTGLINDTFTQAREKMRETYNGVNGQKFREFLNDLCDDVRKNLRYSGFPGMAHLFGATSKEIYDIEANKIGMEYQSLSSIEQIVKREDAEAREIIRDELESGGVLTKERISGIFLEMSGKNMYKMAFNEDTRKAETSMESSQKYGNTVDEAARYVCEIITDNFKTFGLNGVIKDEQAKVLDDALERNFSKKFGLYKWQELFTETLAEKYRDVRTCELDDVAEFGVREFPEEADQLLKDTADYLCEKKDWQFKHFLQDIKYDPRTQKGTWNARLSEPLSDIAYIDVLNKWETVIRDAKNWKEYQQETAASQEKTMESIDQIRKEEVFGVVREDVEGEDRAKTAEPQVQESQLPAERSINWTLIRGEVSSENEGKYNLVDNSGNPYSEEWYDQMMQLEDGTVLLAKDSEVLAITRDGTAMSLSEDLLKEAGLLMETASNGRSF